VNLSRILGILGAAFTTGGASTAGALSVVLTAVGGLLLFFSNPQKAASGEKKTLA
jgi:hypothetical protein